jgi:hypothetical protein
MQNREEIVSMLVQKGKIEGGSLTNGDSQFFAHNQKQGPYVP